MHSIEPGLTIPEVCKILNCSRVLVYKLLARGDLEGYKVGANRRITPASVRRLTKQDEPFEHALHRDAGQVAQ